MSKMTTNTPVPLSPASKTAQRTSVGRRFLGALTRGPYRKFSGSRSHRRLMNKGLAFPVLALLAALAVVLLPGGLLQAQSAEQFFTYAENGEGHVATFTASDPEDAMPVAWSLPTAAVTIDGTEVVSANDVADAALFKIDQSGVLSFRTSPSYEPRGDGDYRVTVQASDGDQTSYFEVYVNVTDREETGKVTWSVDPAGTDDTVPEGVVLRQFQPGASLTASVTDPDAVTSDDSTGGIDADDVTWKWYRGSSVIAGETGASYTVMDGDVGNTIRVMATYSDGSGSEEDVSLTSASVQTFRRSNIAPEFASATVIRRIAENSTGAIGGPVAATDTDGDMLTYAITGGTDQANFRIDPATGQLMVGPGLMIDFEDTANIDDTYTVAVTAYDSSGDATDPVATVTINVINEEEKPAFGDVDDNANPPANLMRAVVPEDATGDGLNIARYTATDPEGEDVSLSLMGDDASLFELNDPDSGDGKVLAFKKSPDFEMPGDRNDDNLYEVTVRASDGTMSADRMVVVKVTNAVEPGKVALSPEDAVPGVELTATLTDPEGGVSASGQITGERWTWHRGSAETFTAATNNAIANATSPTYTPTSTPAPGDVGMYLRAMVSYVYQYEGDADADRKTGVSAAVQVQTSSENQAPRFKEGASTFRVVAEDTDPVTASEEDTTGTDQPADNVGDVVGATDANGDTVTYTLSGADASLFRIRSDDGQLEVKGKLDHEMDSSHTVTVTANDGSGGSNATASIRVTIYVTDSDEAPKIRDRAASSANGQRTVDYAENGEGHVATFTASDPEDAMPVAWSLPTAAVTIDGTEVVSANDVADAALFKIDQSGVLSFRTSPSYEPRGDDDYRVTVQASDGNQTGYFKVTVNVTDREETGKVTWSVDPAGTDDTVPEGVVLRKFQPGAVLAASVTDPDAVTDSDSDGDITGADVTWKWYRGSSAIAGEEGASYTVKDIDAGKTIRVMATYSDGSGSEESVSLTSASVQVASQSNDAPAFASETVTRRISENSTGNVGGPVAATDADGDTLTYAFGSGGANNGDFRIDPATGQLMVGPDLMINYETTQSYTVNVRAYDSLGAVTDPVATVTINVINEEEKPAFGDVDDNANPPANLMRAVVPEDATGDGLNIARYTATDPEGEDVSLSLMGDDASLFELNDPASGDGKVLAFKKSPDFEMPGDRNDDNLYEVTVRASDGTMSADRMVVVKVTNAVEPGKVALSPEDAVPGVELTATLTDPEGGVSASGQITGERWTWHRGSAETFTAATNNAIANATSPTYTPTSTPAPGDVGMYLRAMVSYVYQYEGDADADRKTGVSAAVQVQTSSENQAPRFKEGARTFRVVAENVAALPTDDSTADSGDAVTDDNIGMPVMATDANGDMVTYTLSGADASLFRIRSDDGQLEVKGKLDHEMDSSHTVTVTANDGSGGSNATATITVTIYVTDADEAPKIMVVPTENQAPMFRSSSVTRSIPEGQSSGRAIGSAVTATDPNPGDSLTYTLEGTDAASFSIHSRTGQLRTSAPLVRDTKSTYTVTVKATDRDGLSDTITVTITVTEAGEQMGEVTLWDGTDELTMAPQVGDTITGAVMDPDGGVNVTAWQWARMDTAGVWMDIQDATDKAYMVTADDTGYYLRVMATYTDAVGTDTAMVFSPTTMMVTAEAEDALLAEYDPDGDGTIEIADMRRAVQRFFANPPELSRPDMRRLVGIYFSQQ